MDEERKDIMHKAISLRKSGKKYAQIADILNLNPAKVWQYCNIERQRETSIESRRRWEKRNKVALCEIPLQKF
jgi:predicted transcriptional regulator